MPYKILFILFLAIISCDRINKPEDSKKKEVLQKTQEEGTSEMHYKYTDTVFKNAYAIGEIDYDIDIKGVDNSNILERYIILYTSIDKNAKTFEEIERTKQNAFLDTTPNKSGKFHFEYKFNKSGDKTLKLAFEDLAVYLVDSIKKDTMRIRYSIAELPVYVIDSSAIIGYDEKGPYYIIEKKTRVKRKDSLRRIIEDQRKIDSMKRVLNNQ